ncbi:hypothetical protein DITRI_Ditri06bG0110200 [Diplodiscus trichospermus]
MGGHGQEVKLLGIWFSPYVRRVVWALKQKGIEYELLEENFRDPNSRSQSLTKYNPVLKRVPVLVHNGKPVVESLVILEYLDETWNYNPILPSDPYERAMARFWANFIEQKVIGVLSKLLCLVDDKVMKEEVKQASEALEIVDEELKVKGKKFFGGENIGFVDIVLSGITNWMEAIEEVLGITIFDPQKHPFINQWKNNFLEVPVIKENLPPKHRLLRFYKRYRQSKLAAPSRL